MSIHLEIHPGEILREEFMTPLGLSEGDLVSALGVPQSQISALISESGPITLELAKALAAYFKVSVQFWLNLQTEYEIRKKKSGGKQ